MVLYFKAITGDVLYMGKDKFENEDLIKFAWTEDVWFHVDNLSSAHVYLRMPQGMSWEDIPDQLLQDAAQLTKANSIEGNKRDNISVIYTPSSNLRKDGSMDTGQVAFHKAKQVKKVLVRTRENVIVNRLNKTKDIKTPDLEAEQRAHLIERNKIAKEHFLSSKKEEERRARELKALKEERDRGYNDFLTEDMIAANANDRDDGYDPDEDFM